MISGIMLFVPMLLSPSLRIAFQVASVVVFFKMFGKLTTYFAATRKLNLKAPDEDNDDPTFDNFRDKINGQIPTSGRA